jgi:hypothetical protein
MQLQNLFPTAADLPITFPDGTATGIVLKLVGQDSKQFRDVAKRMAGSMLGQQDKPDVEALDKQGAELAAACIVGWSGIDDGDSSLPYSSAKAIELMSMPELTFIRQQVEGFVSQRTNFFRKGTPAA